LDFNFDGNLLLGHYTLLKVEWLNFFGYPRSAQVTPNPTTKNGSEVKNIWGPFICLCFGCSYLFFDWQKGIEIP
jgi:hypothetical protein